MMKRSSLKVVAIVAVLFGALTVFSGGLALFGGANVQDRFGDAVPFVLWFNFFAGFAYIVAGIGLFQRYRWALWLAVAILITTILILVAFGLYVARGGTYEMRTVGAMFLRSGVWTAIVAVAVRAGIRLSRP
jgi:hypothetical protein